MSYRSNIYKESCFMQFIHCGQCKMASSGLLVVFLVAVLYGPAFGSLPDYVPTCSRNSSDLNGCVLNATVTMMPYVAKGIPELDILPLEPLVVPHIKLDQNTQHVSFKANLTNLTVHGLSYYSFRDVSVDLESLVATGTVYIPRVPLSADYTIQGRVLLMPIKGQGLFTSNATNIVAHFNMKARHNNETGHLESSDTMVKLDVGKVKLNLDNLFDGQEIGKSTNNFVRANSKKIFEEVKPAVESVTAMLVDDATNKLFRTVTEDELFPSN